MDLDKQFIKKLVHRRFATVGQLIGDLDILRVEENSIQNLNEHYERIEKILYTIDYLVRNDLVTTEDLNKSRPTFSPTPFRVDEVLYERLSYIDDLLAEYWNKQITIKLGFYNFIGNKWQRLQGMGFSTYEERKTTLSIAIPVIAAILAAFGTAFFTDIFLQYREQTLFNTNRQKIAQIVNAEIYEYLTVTDKYIEAKNQIVSDVNFASFIQSYRFNTLPLRELLASNFRYLDENDIYRLTIVRDELDSINSKLDILEQSKLIAPRLSNKPECNFAYFTPQDKKEAHRYLNNNFNLLINSIKHLTFFSGNPFERLNRVFDLTDVQISLYYFDYSDEYNQVTFDCD